MGYTTVYTYANLDGERDFDVKLLIYWSKYRPAQGPTYSCGGQPEEPAEIFVEEIYLMRGDRQVYLPVTHRLYSYFDDMELLDELMEFMYEPEGDRV